MADQNRSEENGQKAEPMAVVLNAPPIPECPPNTVQLFQFVKGRFAPSLSPFPIKLETYLRLAGIEYQNDHYMRFSTDTRKLPWIRYNGRDISDSTLIIDFLNKEFGVDLNAGLSDSERAVCTAFERMVDEHLFWVLVHARWISEKGYPETLEALGDIIDPGLKAGKGREGLKDTLYKQGMGRHPEPTVLLFGQKAMKAISDFLGDKPFMMGDQPTQVDCSVFGMLSDIHWNIKDDWLERLIPEHFPNIQAYLERMKARVWPDWDDCITHGGAPSATK